MNFQFLETNLYVGPNVSIKGCTKRDTLISIITVEVGINVDRVQSCKINKAGGCNKRGGWLISKCSFGVIIWTKIPTKGLTNFCPTI
jgi:hypothetical protein